MILEKSQHVICCLKNNAVLEGTVENWSDEEVVLLSLDGQSQLIITHPKDDIIFVKIILHSFRNKKVSEIKNEISKELKCALEEKDEDLKTKSVHRLKSLLIEQDKKIIKEKTKDHQLGQPRIVEYHHPGTNIRQAGK